MDTLSAYLCTAILAALGFFAQPLFQDWLLAIAGFLLFVEICGMSAWIVGKIGPTIFLDIRTILVYRPHDVNEKQIESRRGAGKEAVGKNDESTAFRSCAKNGSGKGSEAVGRAAGGYRVNQQRPITDSRRNYRSYLPITAFLLIFCLYFVPTWGAREGLAVDSRKPWQFRASVVEYLNWRSGSSWRPTSDRFHPDRLTYVSAVNYLNEAWASPVNCSCPYCAGAPFADERKPVSSVRVLPKKAGRA